MDKTKRGIALFITLLVIASILSIVAVSFSYLGKVKQDAGKISALLQGNLLYKNSVEILKRFFPDDKPSSQKLKMIYSIPIMLSEPKSGFSVQLSCKALVVGVPINWLDPKFSPDIPERMELARKVLTGVIELYEIDEPNRLEEMILSKVIGKTTEDAEYEPRIKPKKGIVSKKQFDRVILDYYLRYDDKSVFTVPWEQYFTFIELTKRATIDGAYISAELISMAFGIPLEMVKDEWSIESNIEEPKMVLKKFLEQSYSSEPFNNKLFSAKALNVMHCEERYAYRDIYYGFSFDYSNGRSRNFEFNGEL
jgi:hypothetical protein